MSLAQPRPRVRVQGAVLDQWLGEYVVLQDETGSIRVETRETTRLGGGEGAFAVGEISWDGTHVFLSNASVWPAAWDQSAERKVVPAPGKPDSLPVLTRVGEVRDLPPERAAWKYPVRVQGVVTTVRKDFRAIFVQDDTAGIFVPLPGSGSDLELKVGDLVVVEGSSGPGGFAPVIESTSVKAVGAGKLPEARLVTLYQMATGQCDAQWVEVRGILRSVRANPLSTRLEISDLNGVVEVHLVGGDSLTNLLDSLVRVRGVCGSRANSNRQLVGAYVWSPATNLLVVEEQGVADPFTLPTKPIASLSEFAQWRSAQRRVKIAGVVTFCQPGRPLFVQDESGGMPVYLARNPGLKPGDRVEVAGYLSPGDFGYVFRNASCRVTGRAAIPAPQPVLTANVLNQNLHGTRVELNAQLVDSTRRGNEDLFTLRADNAIFEALRPRDKASVDALPAVGSRVRLRGVYAILGDESRRPRALRLYVPSGEAFQVLETPSWLNSARASTLFGIMVVVLLGAGLWAVTLRRRVRQQTLLIRDRLEKEALLQQQYREIFEGASDLIFTVAVDGRVTSLNPAGTRILGYEPEEARGLTIDQLLDPECLPHFRQLCEGNVTADQVSACEGRLLAKDGREVPVEVSARVRVREGRPVRVDAIARDITERKRAEAAVAEAGSLLQTLLDNSPDCIYFKDRESRFVRVSKAFEKLFHVADTESLRGKTDFDFFLEEHARPAYEDEQEIIRTGQPMIGRLEKETLADGRISWALTNKMPWRDKDGNIIGTFGISKDVTSLKRTEAELARERQLFQALVQHLPDTLYFKDRESRFVRLSKSKVERAQRILERRYREEHPSEKELPEHLKDANKCAEYLVGKSDFDLYPEDRARPAFEQEQEIIRTGQPLIGHIEKSNDGEIGKPAWYYTTKMPWYDEQGNIIGTFGITREITALKEAEQQLAHERELFRALVESLPDNLYFKDRESRFVRVSKSKAISTMPSARARYLALHPEAASQALPLYLTSTEEFEKWIIGKTDFDTYEETFARRALEEEQAIVKTGRAVIGKLEHLPGADGSNRWKMISKMPWRDICGNIIGTFGISRDITTLKETEAKLEVAHQRLIETSRLAGMAEVATDVLHNVGNVLNSVNVSCTLTLDRLRASKVTSLAKVASLLQENRDRLAEFFTQDPRGKQIPEFIGVLSSHLDAERAVALKELEQLVKHIDHIKQIVAMQQNYAKVAGVLEKVNPVELVEDALHINGAALTRHEVSVQRDFQETPPIVTEKHRVMQILVNLIRNAKYALDDVKRPDKLLTIRVATEGANQVKIQVVDNGVGIPPENLTRIFSHGFTTRRKGHGFGLHSSALAVKDLGGSIHVHSDGSGKGAVFTLVLPHAPPVKSPTPV